MSLTTTGITVSCSEKQLNGLIETVYVIDKADLDDASITTSGHAMTAVAYSGVTKFVQIAHARQAATMSISDSTPIEGGRSVTGNLLINLQGLTAADLADVEELRGNCNIVAVVKFFSQKMFVLGWDTVAMSEVAMLPADAEGAAAEEFGGSFNVQLNFAIAQHTLPLEYTGTEAALLA
jgi:hypothetical protein